MKGTMFKGEHNDWYVRYKAKDGSLQSLPLHSDDVEEILELEKVFDNVEARIAEKPEVYFEIVENQKLTGISRSAKLINMYYIQNQ